MNTINLSGSQILVVDDNHSNVDILWRILEPEGYKVATASSGEKALLIAPKLLPDIILLDIMMPGLDGYQTCELLKQNPLTNPIPIIFITAKNQVEDVVKGFKLGAVDFISKPIRHSEVKVRVKTHLENRILIRHLQGSNEQFHLLASMSPVGIFQTDAMGNALYVNAQWGKIIASREFNLSTPLWDNVALLKKVQFLEDWNLCLLNGQDFKCEVQLERDGFQWINIQATAIHSFDKKLHGYVGTIDDISKRKQLENKIINTARESAQAKVDFMSHMTHELKTPLNAIIGYSEMLSEVFEETESEEFEDIQKVSHAGKYLLSLINKIMDFSKIDAGKLDIDIAKINIEKLMNDLILTTAPLLNHNKNTLKIDIAENLPVLHSDYTQIKQVLLNLLSNANKFTDNDEILLAVSSSSQQIQFKMIDHGIGLSEAQAKQLFTPFKQVHANHAKQKGGTGLGLVICKKICHLLGGNITCYGESNKGATFTVTLPLTITCNE